MKEREKPTTERIASKLYACPALRLVSALHTLSFFRKERKMLEKLTVILLLSWSFQLIHKVIPI